MGSEGFKVAGRLGVYSCRVGGLSKYVVSRLISTLKGTLIGVFGGLLFQGRGT